MLNKAHLIGHYMKHTYGLVVCGGESSRMGMDKSLLVYHRKPQRYHVYDLMKPFCNKVFISCNASQASAISEGYDYIIDRPEFSQVGPMAALLSAFAAHPEADFLVAACDYPFMRADDLKSLLLFDRTGRPAVSCYNPVTGMEEPLLAVYSKDSYPDLLDRFNNQEYSLRRYLQSVDAPKIVPASPESMVSVDTPEAYSAALEKIRTAYVQL